MGLNFVSNSGFAGSRGGKNIAGIGAGGIPWALATGGSTSDVSYQGQAVRQHIFNSSGSLTVTRAGFMTVFLLAAGGSGGIRNPGNQDPNYNGGGGGGGGYYFNENYFIEPGVYAVTIGTAGSAPSNGGNSSFNSIVCGGGGHGAQSLSYTTNGNPGNAGSNGGGTGAQGGGGSAPGYSVNNGPGYFDHMRTYWGVRYALSGGGSTANTGNGGPGGAGNVGASGRFIVRYILSQ